MSQAAIRHHWHFACASAATIPPSGPALLHLVGNYRHSEHAVKIGIADERHGWNVSEHRLSDPQCHCLASERINGLVRPKARATASGQHIACHAWAGYAGSGTHDAHHSRPRNACLPRSRNSMPTAHFLALATVSEQRRGLRAIHWIRLMPAKTAHSLLLYLREVARLCHERRHSLCQEMKCTLEELS